MAKNTSDAQIEANRANSQHSTGPKTEEGKRIASHNALKTGLTGRTVLLPTDDIAEYEAHLARIESRYQPANDEERFHTQNIAHLEWRLLRIPTLETAFLAVGRKRFADTHQDEPAETRALMIEAEVHLALQKPLANLELQESRLNRQHERELAKLTALQTARKATQAKLINEAYHLYVDCGTEGRPFPFQELTKLGFEFSHADILRRGAHYTVGRTAWPTLKAAFTAQELISQIS